MPGLRSAFQQTFSVTIIQLTFSFTVTILALTILYKSNTSSEIREKLRFLFPKMTLEKPVKIYAIINLGLTKFMVALYL